MTDAPARPKTLDHLKDAFLKNAIRTEERAFDLRETVIADVDDPASEAALRPTNDTKPAESRP